jgi:hypothetical protein
MQAPGGCSVKRGAVNHELFTHQCSPLGRPSLYAITTDIPNTVLLFRVFACRVQPGA